MQQVCGYFFKKFRQLLLTNKPAEKIFDKCPQSCVNSRSPMAFPHISYCQGQDSHNVLASYQGKTWTDTALQSQALVSTMGKLHYKGKENFTSQSSLIHMVRTLRLQAYRWSTTVFLFWGGPYELCIAISNAKPVDQILLSEAVTRVPSLQSPESLRIADISDLVLWGKFQAYQREIWDF